MDHCSNCPMHRGLKCKVPSRGYRDGILFVSEFPDHISAKCRHPYVSSSPAGIEFETFLAKADIRLADYSVGYLVKCRPLNNLNQEGNLKKDVITHCTHYLKHDIQRYTPKVIVTLGKNVFKYFFPDRDFAENRGALLYSEEYDAVVIPTYDPESAVKTAKFDPIILLDFIKAKQVILGIAEQPKPTKYIACTDLDLFDRAMNTLMDAPLYSFDIETHTTHYIKGKTISIAFSWQEDTAISIPLYIRDDKYEVTEIPNKVKDLVKYFDEYRRTHVRPLKYWGDKQDYVNARLKEVLENSAEKIAHNGTFDCLFLRTLNIVVNNYCHDTLVMHHLLEEEGMHDLETLAERYTDKGRYKLMTSEYLPNSESSYLLIPTDVLLEYNAKDADTTFTLYHKFKPRLEAEGLWSLYSKVVMPLQNILIDITHHGAYVDKEYVEQINRVYAQRIEELERQIYTHLVPLYGRNLVLVQDSTCKKDKNFVYFNINSTKHLADLFFKRMQVKPIKEGGTGYSLDEEVLSKYAKKYPIAELILKYRGLKKLKGTYLEATLDNMDDSCRLHAKFFVTGTKTGRLASKDPNLQTIPQNKEIKRMFCARPGYVLAEADMSQHELRVLAGTSGDPVMGRVFKSGGDIHDETGADIFSCKKEDLKGDKHKRTISKRVNFGIAYDISAQGLVDILAMEGISITVDEAQEYIDKWCSKYHVAFGYLTKCKKDFIINGYLQTIFGRKRRYPKRFVDDGVVRAMGRQAQNFPIQSTASDIVSYVTVKLYPLLKAEGINVIITVHDALIMEVPVDKIQRLKELLKQHTFITWPQLHNVPIQTDLKIGERWGEMKDESYDEKTST